MSQTSTTGLLTCFKGLASSRTRSGFGCANAPSDDEGSKLKIMVIAQLLEVKYTYTVYVGKGHSTVPSV